MKTYTIANYKGDLIAHDITSEIKAKLILADIQKREPDNEWEIIEVI